MSEQAHWNHRASSPRTVAAPVLGPALDRRSTSLPAPFQAACGAVSCALRRRAWARTVFDRPRSGGSCFSVKVILRHGVAARRRLRAPWERERASNAGQRPKRLGNSNAVQQGSFATWHRAATALSNAAPLPAHGAGLTPHCACMPGSACFKGIDHHASGFAAYFRGARDWRALACVGPPKVSCRLRTQRFRTAQLCLRVKGATRAFVPDCSFCLRLTHAHVYQPDFMT